MGVALVTLPTWKCVPTAISSVADISGIPRSHLLLLMSSQWGLQKLLQGFVSHEPTPFLSVFALFLTQWIIAILSKGCKPENFASHNSPRLNFTNIQDLHSNFVECEPFLELNSPDILPLCETNLVELIHSGNFSVWGYFPLTKKDAVTHMHEVVVYVTEELPFVWDISLEKSADSYVFEWLYFIQCLVSFSSIDHLLRPYARFLIVFYLA